MSFFSRIFGSGSGGLLGTIGDVLGGLGGFALGGPVGAALGAEAGGTLGGLAGGEKIGQAALQALPGAALAGLGGYGAEALGGVTPATGTDLLGISGTPTTTAGLSPDAAALVSGASPQAPTLMGSGGGQTVGVFSNLVDQAGTVDPTAGVASASPDGSGWVPSSGGAPPSSVSATGGWTDTSADPYLSGGDLKSVTASGGGGSGGVLGGIADTLGIRGSSVLPAGIAALGLGKAVLSGNQVPKGYNPLTTEAAQTGTTGAAMQQYLTSGTLPTGLQTGLNQAVASAKSTIRAHHAAAGDSGSTAEAQELAQVDMQAQSQGAQLAATLFDQGLKATDISQSIYKTLMQTDMGLQQQTGSAIANLASALSGTPNITIGKVA